MKKQITLLSVVLFLCGTLVAQDVYVCGSQGNAAKVWKNGEELYALTDGAYEARAHAMAISNAGDIYVTGYEKNSNGRSIAKVWKNGSTLYFLTSVTSDGEGHSIAISGDNIYVAGNSRTVAAAAPQNGVANDALRGDVVGVWKATVWKNGTLYTCSDVSSLAYSIVASGSDIYIYVSDHVSGVGQVWKNTSILYAISDTHLLHFHKNPVAVSGNDVYVAGEVIIPYSPQTVINVWKNNDVLYSLSGSSTNIGGTIYSSHCSMVISGNDIYVSVHT
ncbi:MAG: hypothetical protein LBG77_01325 [Dysgonamonadaceae bacterium]|jgi:hypothetical protein|nr:hypothetical protein [Dysgonamonadaceae bacterium]